MMAEVKGNQIQAVLFDWDMTLGATLGGVSIGERLAALFQRVGLVHESEAITAAIEQYQEAVLSGRLRGHLIPQEKADIIHYYQELLAILGQPEVPPQLAAQIYSEYAHLPFVFYEDTRPTLAALAERGLRLGIITNHSPAIRAVIEQELAGFVSPHHILISGELDLYKPDPAIFREAANRLETPAGACMYIGDNLQVDAIGAVAAGGYGRGLWCDRAGQATPADLPGGVYRISELSQALAYIEAV
jgi:putative hydrolase of the HAD superfamily